MKKSQKRQFTRTLAIITENEGKAKRKQRDFFDSWNILKGNYEISFKISEQYLSKSRETCSFENI